jgi:DNA-directed RNA polymerase
MGVSSVKMRKGKGEYDKLSSVSSISPNFVHSLDSAHLCKTINTFDGRIVPIHDSFATHPSDVPAMHDVLRSTFVDMYSTDVAALLLELLEPAKELPVRPKDGDLDLIKVLESPFMFC